MGRNGRIDLNAAAAFVQVVEAGGFRGAATVMGVPKSTLSRKVAELEGQLGAQLLIRDTRRVRLTEVGQAYHRQAAVALATLEDAARGVDELQSEPRGVLRISVPVAMGQTMLGELLAGFLAAHPHVHVVADVTDRTVDLREEGFDAALRVGFLPDSTLVARKLAESRLQIVASPTYLNHRKRPRTPEELSTHDCLLFPGVPGPLFWEFRRGRRAFRVQVKGRCAAGSFPAVLSLAEAGFGIARLPAFMAEASVREGRLVALLEAYAPPPAPLHLVYPASRIVPPKLRAFVDHLVANGSRLLPQRTRVGRSSA